MVEVEEDEKDDKSSSAASSASETAAITAEFDTSLFRAKKVKYERPKAMPEDEEFNEEIKKPFVTKVTNEGLLEMNLDTKRFIEASNSTEGTGQN